MRKEELTFDSRDGKSKIYATAWIPDGQVEMIVQIVHGMNEHVDRYERFAKFLCENGILVTGEDHLGHGRTGEAMGIFGYFCPRDPATVVVRDVHRLKKLMQEKYPGRPYVILGHSMGSFIARNYMFRYGKGIDAMIVMGTGYQSRGTVVFGKALATFLSIFQGGKHRSALIEKIAFGGQNDRIQEDKTGNDWLTRDEAICRKYAEDPWCGGRFTLNGYKTLFELLIRLTEDKNLQQIPKDLPVLFVSGSDDPVGAYGAGVQQAVDSLKNVGMTDVSVKIYEGDRHEILNELDYKKVQQDLYDWIVSKVRSE